MKIMAFRVAQKGPRSFFRIIDLLNGKELADRFFGGEDLRFEHKGDRGGFLLADFVRARGGHGPGRMSRGQPLAEIRLREGDDFGEDTGLAYDPDSGFAAVQYNHFGPRSSTIENYLFAFDLSLGNLRTATGGESDQDRCGFRFGAVLKPDAYVRLRRFGIIHEVEFEVSVPGARALDLKAGRSLGDVLRAPLPQGTATLTMGIKAAPGRDGALGHVGAMGVIEDIQRLGGEVRRALVKGKPTREDRLDTVDLIEDRLSLKADIGLGVGRRYSRADRWTALQRALRGWLDSGQLQ